MRDGRNTSIKSGTKSSRNSGQGAESSQRVNSRHKEEEKPCGMHDTLKEIKDGVTRAGAQDTESSLG